MQEHDKNGNCLLINNGLALAMAYVYLVYPHETVLNFPEVEDLDWTVFRTCPEVRAPQLVKRLRNALAHGRYELQLDGKFYFHDMKANGTDRFEAEVNWADFGQLMIQFGGMVAVHLENSTAAPEP